MYEYVYVPYNTDDSTPPLNNTPPYKITPGGIFLDSFSTVTFITGGTLNTTPPSDVRLKTYQTPKHHSRWTPFTHNTHAPVWIPVPAWRQLLRPITVGRSSLRPGPHRYLLLPRLERGSRRFFPGPPRLPVSVLVLALLRCSDPGSSSRIASHYDSHKRRDDAAR